MIKKLVLEESEVIAKLEVKYNGVRDIPTCLIIDEIDNRCIISLTIEQTEQLIMKLQEIVDMSKYSVAELLEIVVKNYENGKVLQKWNL